MNIYGTESGHINLTNNNSVNLQVLNNLESTGTHVDRVGDLLMGDACIVLWKAD